MSFYALFYWGWITLTAAIALLYAVSPCIMLYSGLDTGAYQMREFWYIFLPGCFGSVIAVRFFGQFFVQMMRQRRFKRKLDRDLRCPKPIRPS